MAPITINIAKALWDLFSFTLYQSQSLCRRQAQLLLFHQSFYSINRTCSLLAAIFVGDDGSTGGLLLASEC